MLVREGIGSYMVVEENTAASSVAFLILFGVVVPREE